MGNLLSFLYPVNSLCRESSLVSPWRLFFRLIIQWKFGAFIICGESWEETEPKSRTTFSTHYNCLCVNEPSLVLFAPSAVYDNSIMPTRRTFSWYRTLYALNVLLRIKFCCTHSIVSLAPSFWFCICMQANWSWNYLLLSAHIYLHLLQILYLKGQL